MESLCKLDTMRPVKMVAMCIAAMAAGAAMPVQAAWETPRAATLQLAEQNAIPAPGITATVNRAYYQITSGDVARTVAEQLQSQAVETKAQATLNPGTPSVLYSGDRTITLVVHGLQVDPQTKRWQAQAHFMVNGKTESVRPVGGLYEKLVDVPVVSRQLNRDSVIEEKDLTFKAMPERQLRKDVILDTKQLIGTAPKSGITPGRPIHANEIAAPLVIKRGDLVEMAFHTTHIHIKTTGIALEDGSKGATIRVKNQKSQLAVSAKVEAAGRVTVAGSDATL